jgi:hypothetical protein
MVIKILETRSATEQLLQIVHHPLMTRRDEAWTTLMREPGMPAPHRSRRRIRLYIYAGIVRCAGYGFQQGRGRHG